MNFKIFFAAIVCVYMAFSLNAQAMSEDEEETKCRFFNGKPGSCRYGKDCRFSHSAETAGGQCLFFNGKPGSCRYGKDCRFKHARESRDQYRERHAQMESGAKETPEQYSERRRKADLKRDEERLDRARYEQSPQYKLDQEQKYAEREQRQKEYEERQRQRQERQRRHDVEWSPSGYRIGSTADPHAAQQMLDQLSRERAAGLPTSYAQSLQASHAYDTLHRPEGRLVGDGRGGTFEAIPGKDDN